MACPFFKVSNIFPSFSLGCYRCKQRPPSSLIHLCVFPHCMWAEKTDSPDESQLQLASVSFQPVGYGPWIVVALHIVFSPPLSASPLFAHIKLIRPNLGISLISSKATVNQDIFLCLFLHQCIWLGTESKLSLQRLVNYLTKGTNLLIATWQGGF